MLTSEFRSSGLKVRSVCVRRHTALTQCLSPFGNINGTGKRFAQSDSNRLRSIAKPIDQYSNMDSRLSGQNCKVSFVSQFPKEKFVLKAS